MFVKTYNHYYYLFLKVVLLDTFFSGIRCESSVNSTVEDNLKSLINAFKFNCNDWRSFFINPKQEWHILDGIKNSQIQIVSDDEIYLNQGNTGVTSWGWSRVAELRSFYVYSMLKLKDESVHYYPASEVKDVCFYFDMKNNNKDLALDIKYDIDKKKFRSKLFYRDGSSLPEVFNNCELEFELCCESNFNNDDIQVKISNFIENINKKSYQ